MTRINKCVLYPNGRIPKITFIGKIIQEILPIPNQVERTQSMFMMLINNALYLEMNVCQVSAYWYYSYRDGPLGTLLSNRHIQSFYNYFYNCFNYTISFQWAGSHPFTHFFLTISVLNFAIFW